MLLLLLFFLCLISIYLIEVVLGTCAGELNPELGFSSNCDKLTHLSNRKFFTQLLPILLCIFGLLYLFANIIHGKLGAYQYCN